MNPVMAEKVADCIRQIDVQNSKSFNFLANQRLLKVNDMEKWVKLHHQSMQSIKTMHKTEIAEEIFKVWDKRLLRYILFGDFANHLITLGVAPDQATVRKIMLAVKGPDASFPDQLNFKEFSRLFSLSRFEAATCEAIEAEFKAENRAFVH